MAAKTGTYTLIASDTLTSGKAGVSFTSIPGNYTDLIVVISTKSTTDSYVKVSFNSDTGSNYSFTRLYGTGTTAGSNRGSNMTYWQSFYTTNGATFNTVIMQVFDYANTTTNKTSLMRENTASAEVDAHVGMWRSTAAITAISFDKVSGNFDSGSTFKLYGIEAGNQ